MQDPAEKILEDALGLDDKQRARIAHALISSLDGEPEEGVEEAWDQEIARRVAEVREGKVKLIPWDEFEAEAEALLANSGK